MEIVEVKYLIHQEEGFTKAVRLEEIDIEKFTELLKAGKAGDVWKKIIDFASKKGHNMPFIDDEDGDKAILLEIREKQWVFFADIPGIRNGLNCVLLNHVPS